MAQRRPGEHLCPILPVPRVRLPAGDEQRGLARDAEVRHSGARSHRFSAVAGAARSKRALGHLSIHFFLASLCGASCHTKEQRRHGRSRINCRTTTVKSFLPIQQNPMQNGYDENKGYGKVL